MKSRFVKIGCLMLTLVMGVSLLLTGCGGAGKYPNKSIELTVPFAAGGPVDLSARILCGEAEKTLSQKIVVVNKGGGGATEGQSYVAKASPDGYYLLAMTSSLLSNTMTKKVDYKVESFTPIMMYSYDPEVFIVPYDSPYQTINDLIEASKTTSVSCSTPGHSTSHHMAGVLLEQKTGAKFDYVHTDGASESVPMVAGGHVQAGLTNWSEVKSLVEAKKLRVLGVMSEEKDSRMPDVPTFKESGIDIIYGAWRGIAVPAGTPADVVTTLQDSFKKAIESKAVTDKLAEQGIPILYKNAADFKTHIDQEYKIQKEISAIIAQQKK
jgi:tripartite-type tricarboxylate transporter receptor subunit TctC